jgi:predicted transcriptional regulator
MKNFHLPLPTAIHEALRREAAELRRPATALAREAIEGWLRERRRAVVRESIATYAAQHAGSVVDLDPVLESPSLGAWRRKKSGR